MEGENKLKKTRVVLDCRETGEHIVTFKHASKREMLSPWGGGLYPDSGLGRWGNWGVSCHTKTMHPMHVQEEVKSCIQF